MGCSCFRFWQYMIAVFLLFSAALYITAGSVNYWWVTKSTYLATEEGLWQSCIRVGNAQDCTTRKKILKFEDTRLDTLNNAIDLGKETNLNKDIVMVSLAVGALLTLIPLIFVAITMCQRYPSKMTILIGSVFLFFGMCAGIFGTIWALAKISSKNQGWAFFCVYGADGFAIISFVLCIALLVCVKAPGAYRTHNRDDEIAMLAR